MNATILARVVTALNEGRSRDAIQELEPFAPRNGARMPWFMQMLRPVLTPQMHLYSIVKEILFDTSDEDSSAYAAIAHADIAYAALMYADLHLLQDWRSVCHRGLPQLEVIERLLEDDRVRAADPSEDTLARVRIATQGFTFEAVHELLEKADEWDGGPDEDEYVSLMWRPFLLGRWPRVLSLPSQQMRHLFLDAFIEMHNACRRLCLEGMADERGALFEVLEPETACEKMLLCLQKGIHRNVIAESLEGYLGRTQSSWGLVCDAISRHSEQYDDDALEVLRQVEVTPEEMPLHVWSKMDDGWALYADMLQELATVRMQRHPMQSAYDELQRLWHIFAPKMRAEEVLRVADEAQVGLNDAEQEAIDERRAKATQRRRATLDWFRVMTRAVYDAYDLKMIAPYGNEYPQDVNVGSFGATRLGPWVALPMLYLQPGQFQELMQFTEWHLSERTLVMDLHTTSATGGWLVVRMAMALIAEMWCDKRGVERPTWATHWTRILPNLQFLFDDFDLFAPNNGETLWHGSSYKQCLGPGMLATSVASLLPAVPPEIVEMIWPYCLALDVALGDQRFVHIAMFIFDVGMNPDICTERSMHMAVALADHLHYRWTPNMNPSTRVIIAPNVKHMLHQARCLWLGLSYPDRTNAFIEQRRPFLQEIASRLAPVIVNYMQLIGSLFARLFASDYLTPPSSNTPMQAEFQSCLVSAVNYYRYSAVQRHTVDTLRQSLDGMSEVGNERMDIIEKTFPYQPMPELMESTLRETRHLPNPLQAQIVALVNDLQLTPTLHKHVASRVNAQRRKRSAEQGDNESNKHGRLSGRFGSKRALL